MPKLFSSFNKKFLSQIDKPEKELNKFICKNWKDLFPKYTFIASTFKQKRFNTRSFGILYGRKYAGTKRFYCKQITLC
jgi:hypothetical protein